MRLQLRVTRSIAIGRSPISRLGQGGRGAISTATRSVLAGQFNTATTTAGVNLATPLKDMQNLAVHVRIHKDFLP